MVCHSCGHEVKLQPYDNTFSVCPKCASLYYTRDIKNVQELEAKDETIAALRRTNKAHKHNIREMQAKIRDMRLRIKELTDELNSKAFKEPEKPTPATTTNQDVEVETLMRSIIWPMPWSTRKQV